MLTLFAVVHQRQTQKRKGMMWVRDIFKKRQEKGEFHTLLQKMRLNDTQSHFRYLQMSNESFETLLEKVSPLISHRSYFSEDRASITPAERLSLTIRYLATGNSQVSLSFNFRIGRSTVTAKCPCLSTSALGGLLFL